MPSLLSELGLKVQGLGGVGGQPLTRQRALPTGRVITPEAEAAL